MQVQPPPLTTSGLPPSPTLTNPDMILPFDLPQSPIARDSGSPITSGEDERRPRPNMKDPQSRIRHAKQNLSPFRNGILATHDGSLTRSNSDRQHGRIKVENSRLVFRPNGDATKPSPGSPLVDQQSPGTDSVPQTSEGDDDLGAVQNTYRTPSILDEDENDPESHAAMTKRAEEILANAKKRLNNMEGNLTRARSTIGSRPSSSMSSFPDRDPPYNREKVSRLKHRQGHLTLRDDHQGHSRVFSETSVPSSLQSPTKAASNEMAPEDGSEPTRNWFWNGIGRSGGNVERAPRGLQRLDEDDIVDSFEQQQAAEDEAEETLQIRAFDNGVEVDSAELSPSFGLSRSRSTNQMRDLRDQMTDLKGKITSLRRKAREDSLKRRSLQSLRTPSPLNNAEQDYSSIPLSGGQDRGPEIPFNKEHQERKMATMKEQTDMASSGEATLPPAQSHVQEPVTELDIPASSAHTRGQQTSAAARTKDDELPDKAVGKASSKITSPPVETDLTTSEVAEEPIEPTRAGEKQVADPASRNTDGAVLEEADGSEKVEEPVGERHEDRADAFDYEHFFLTSSMGHYARKRGSTHSSEYSTETERPPTMVLDSKIDEEDVKDESPSRHLRQHSNSSASSLGTFATATEGEESEESEDSDEHEWTPRQTMAGTWLVDAPAAMTNGDTKKHSKIGSRKVSDSKQDSSVKRHRREHSVTDAGVNAPVPEAPDVMALLKAILSREKGGAVDLKLNDSDVELAERTVASVAHLCFEMQNQSNRANTEEATACRRRLHSGRRHLDGLTHGEMF